MKLYPFDQTTETLMDSNFERNTSAFMQTVEVTTDEIAKYFLLKFRKIKKFLLADIANKNHFQNSMTD